MKMSRTVTLVGALLLAAGTAEAGPRVPTHVACVGDSITAGSGASSSSTNYPADLQGLFGSSVQVRNFGHSGATMLSTGDKPYVNQSEYTGATSFVSGAGADAVVDVIIMLGTNDSKPANWSAAGGGTQATQFATDCGKLVDHFASLATHPVVYLALPPTAGTNSYTIDGAVIKNQILPILKQVATQKALPIIDLQTPTASVPKDFGDGVHPNDTGYVLVAQVMHDGLLRVPTVSITSPAAGATVAGPTVTIAAEASGGTVAIKTVEILRGPTSIGTTSQSPFTVSWTGAAPGPYSLTATATDTTGASATSAAVAITVSGSGSGAGAGTAGAGGHSATGGSSGTGGGSGTGGAPGSGGAATGGGAGPAGASGSTGGAGAGGAATGGGSGTGATGGSSATGGQPGATGGPSTDSGCSCSVRAPVDLPAGVLPVLPFGLFLYRRGRRARVRR
ncbi:MAG TPA: GDSL-type esterase/lipase family protein [Polyangia bacterium]|nr:GDSL-type esterase/lipase family protein [Polyangia bacterium]